MKNVQFEDQARKYVYQIRLETPVVPESKQVPPKKLWGHIQRTQRPTEELPMSKWTNVSKETKWNWIITQI